MCLLYIGRKTWGCIVAPLPRIVNLQDRYVSSTSVSVSGWYQCILYYTSDLNPVSATQGGHPVSVWWVQRYVAHAVIVMVPH